VQRMLELFRDLNSTPKDLICVIDKDPVVTVKILKVINSAHHSFPKQFASIGHAVVSQGFNFIKNLTLSIAYKGFPTFVKQKSIVVNRAAIDHEI
jgi:HD-like signal output (HDOD) protein